MNRFFAAALFSLAFSFPAFADHLTFDNAFVRETPSKVTAGYVTIKNGGDTDDVLESVSATWADKAELHDMKTDDSGVMSMAPHGPLDIKAGTDATLAPGGKHIMIYDVKETLKAGETKTITLHFKNDGAIEVPFAVQPITYTGKDAATAHDATHEHHH